VAASNKKPTYYHKRQPKRQPNSASQVAKSNSRSAARRQNGAKPAPSRKARKTPNGRQPKLRLVKPPGLGNRASKSSSLRRILAPAIYSARLLITGIGLGVVVGTMLSLGHPRMSDRQIVSSPTPSPPVKNAVVESNSAMPTAVVAPTPLKLEKEILPLKEAIADLAAQSPRFKPSVFIIDLATGDYLDKNGNKSISSASTIKVPILVAFFQDVESGKIRLDELLTANQKDLASKSTTRYTALEAATRTIAQGDNIATNLLIERLGGKEVLNQRFSDWGLTATVIHNPPPDSNGKNTTSSKDLAYLLAQVDRGELISLKSRERLWEIMKNTKHDRLLARGLGKDAAIAHKAGYVGSMLADVGIVSLPGGKRYAIAVAVQRPRQNGKQNTKAEAIISKISRLAYQHFQPPTPNG
jgi:beta-lactamase class A